MAAGEVGGDAVEPGQRVGAIVVVAARAAQGAGEGLGRQLLGDGRVEPATQVGVDRVVVAIEDRREGRRLRARPRDDLRVAGRTHRRHHDRIARHVAHAPSLDRIARHVARSPSMTASLVTSPARRP